jgi:proteasome accessory factor C
VVAVVHLERHARWVADYYPVDEVEELGDGRLRVTLRVGDPRWLVRLALRLAPAVTVVEPAELRDEVSRTADATLRLYGQGTAHSQDDGVA